MSWRPEWEEAPQRRFGFGGIESRGFFATAPLARGLVLACVAVTVVSAILQNWLGFEGSSRELKDPLRWLALSAENAPFVYPFVTYVLPHSTFDPLHIVLNMVMLWILGQELEVRLGKRRFATLFFGAAVFGALAHLALSSFSRIRPGVLMGASGGILALIFFIARESPGRPFFFFFFAVPARVLAILLVILDAWPILFRGMSDGVAHACHLAGAGFGWVFQRHPFDAFEAFARARAALRERSAQRAARLAEEDDREMDRLLRKIHDHGIGSLTDAERRFLDERSRSLRGGRR
jgi:membrane associated rhomboid family serine protease